MGLFDRQREGLGLQRTGAPGIPSDSADDELAIARYRYLLPDVCLSNGVFLDGTSPADLPRPVEIVPTDGHALRAALESRVPASA